jgi:hypothetical protein
MRLLWTISDVEGDGHTPNCCPSKKLMPYTSYLLKVLPMWSCCVDAWYSNLLNCDLTLVSSPWAVGVNDWCSSWLLSIWHGMTQTVDHVNVMLLIFILPSSLLVSLFVFLNLLFFLAKRCNIYLLHGQRASLKSNMKKTTTVTLSTLSKLSKFFHVLYSVQFDPLILCVCVCVQDRETPKQ